MNGGDIYTLSKILGHTIRDREKLEDLKEELKKNGTRDYMLFYQEHKNDFHYVTVY